MMENHVAEAAVTQAIQQPQRLSSLAAEYPSAHPQVPYQGLSVRQREARGLGAISRVSHSGLVHLPSKQTQVGSIPTARSNSELPLCCGPSMVRARFPVRARRKSPGLFRSLATEDGAEPSFGRSSDTGATPVASTMDSEQGPAGDLPDGLKSQSLSLRGANQDRRRLEDRSCARNWLTLQATNHNCEQRQRSRGSAPRGVSEAALAGRVATEARHSFHHDGYFPVGQRAARLISESWPAGCSWSAQAGCHHAVQGQQRTHLFRRPDLDTQQARPLFPRAGISPAHLYGVASCPKYRASLIWPPENPRDRIVPVGTKLSRGNSGPLPRCYGRSRRLTSLPISPRLMSARRSDGFAVNTNRRCQSSWLSSTKCFASRRSLICGEAA